MPTSGKRTTPEGAVLRACLTLLAIRGIPAWRNNSGVLNNPSGRPVRFGTVGSSDVLGVLPPTGRLLSVELKAPGRMASLTEAQYGFLVKVRDAGGVALVIDDVRDLSTVLDELRDDPGRVYELPHRPRVKAKGEVQGR